MNWEQLLSILIQFTPAGTITTYRDLALYIYKKPTATQAVASMLKAAVKADDHHAIYTNRVINASGKVADVNGQMQQLLSELIPFKDQTVDLAKARVAKLT
jgi:alkylated DNA nucleotide flippase Atl1